MVLCATGRLLSLLLPEHVSNGALFQIQSVAEYVRYKRECQGTDPLLLLLLLLLLHQFV